jgi:hypothetical protein
MLHSTRIRHYWIVVDPFLLFLTGFLTAKSGWLQPWGP